jgi:hypothetical protein
LVNGEKDGLDLQTLNYTGLIPILINEVKNLKKKINTQDENTCTLSYLNQPTQLSPVYKWYNETQKIITITYPQYQNNSLFIYKTDNISENQITFVLPDSDNIIGLTYSFFLNFTNDVTNTPLICIKTQTSSIYLPVSNNVNNTSKNCIYSSGKSNSSIILQFSGDDWYATSNNNFEYLCT